MRYALTPVKTPLVAKKMFPNYIWDIPTTDKVLYLTFDDGPTPEITNWVLDTLKEYHAKATFFCIGNNIEKHPEIFQNILDEAHSIGNHTHNHVKGWKTKSKDYLKNIEAAQKTINNQILNNNSEIINHQSSIVNHQSSIINRQSPIINLFRPPYGQITPKQGKKLIAWGYKIIMWDVLSFDWDHTVSEETCLNNVTSKATNGSVIVFHDSVKASKNMQYTLPKTLEFFSKKGYSFKAIKSEKK
ncbi:polysaccharide deacetylase family protein [Flavivirga spongiicola]|uniref:Polysaccharide deacetylase family protein n=1 Tax=Flavivirga spongiicola TaxID=421621 RepID=A0ABU7XUF8_9FLAO|nr:polysaccharide deacetylase family protein [Flavivirga sp. MEBiC05379]MDO5979392.1 polysaccharide deacetylase family protein [Flavivirga sp. MEBiC05379]